MKCASQNQVLFSAPTVKFVFANGVTTSLKRKIEKRGATVSGEIVTIDDDEDDNSDYESDDSDSETSSNDSELSAEDKHEHFENGRSEAKCVDTVNCPTEISFPMTNLEIFNAVVNMTTFDH